MANFKVKHTQVGAFEEGRVVSEEQIRAIHGKDCDIARLVSLGALEAVQQAPTEEPLKAGPQNPSNPGEGYKAPVEPTDDDKRAADQHAEEQEKLSPEAEPQRQSAPVPVRPTKKA